MFFHLLFTEGESKKNENIKKLLQARISAFEIKCGIRRHGKTQG